MIKRSDFSVYRSIEISRRTLLGYTAAFAATMLGATRASRAQQKTSKQAAQYQDSPRGDDQKCADCRFFVEGGSCQLVEGDISPNGWCTLFQPKA